MKFLLPVFILLLCSCSSIKYIPLTNNEVDQKLVARALQLAGNWMISCDRNTEYEEMQPVIATENFIEKMTDKKRTDLCSSTRKKYGEFKYATHIQAHKLDNETGDIAYRFKSQHSSNVMSELRVTMTPDQKIRDIEVLDWKDLIK